MVPNPASFFFFVFSTQFWYSWNKIKFADDWLDSNFGSVVSEATTLLTVWLTSCLTGLDSAALFMLVEQQINLFGQFQTLQPVGHLYSDIASYKRQNEQRLCA